MAKIRIVNMMFYGFHGIYEYICLEDMEKVSEILIEIVRLYSK